VAAAHVLANAGAKGATREEQYADRIRQSGALVEHLVKAASSWSAGRW
jgi:hypothetical protein